MLSTAIKLLCRLHNSASKLEDKCKVSSASTNKNSPALSQQHIPLPAFLVLRSQAPSTLNLTKSSSGGVQLPSTTKEVTINVYSGFRLNWTNSNIVAASAYGFRALFPFTKPQPVPWVAEVEGQEATINSARFPIFSRGKEVMEHSPSENLNLGLNFESPNSFPESLNSIKRLLHEKDGVYPR
ncbi:unnamed protein product [Rhodiola kirilowii]